MCCLFSSNASVFIQVYGKNYFQIEHYIPKRVMEKMALPCVREELQRLHAININLPKEDAEIEFLKVMNFPAYYTANPSSYYECLGIYKNTTACGSF